MMPALDDAHVRLTVPFYDCDPFGCVWHGRYFQYFEQARTALLRRHDVGERAVQHQGLHMYIVDARCRYMSPLHFGDEIEVSARFTSFEPLIRVAYTVQNLTENQKSARGYTVLALTDTDRNRISGIPESLIAHLKPSA